MKKLLNIIVALFLMAMCGCVNMELHKLKKCPSIPACCDYLNSHPDSSDYKVALGLYDELWENAKYTLKNAGVDSAATCYLDDLVEYMYANKQYVVRLEIDSAVEVKGVKEYGVDVKALYEIINKSINKTLSDRGIEHAPVDVSSIADVDRSQIHGYPQLIRNGLQKAFDRVLSDSTLIVSIDHGATIDAPVAKVSYRILNCELPLGEYQVPLFTKVISKGDELAKKAIARHLKSQGAQVNEDILNNGMGNTTWKIGIQYEVSLTIPGSDTQYSYSFFVPYSGTDNDDIGIYEDDPYAKQALSCFHDFENIIDTLFIENSVHFFSEYSENF